MWAIDTYVRLIFSRHSLKRPAKLVISSIRCSGATDKKQLMKQEPKN